MTEQLIKPLAMLPGLDPVESPSAAGPERRGKTRYPFTATAEVAELRYQTRITGRSSDLGLGGCYIDTISPFAVASVVRVRLERESHRFEAMAKITYSHPSMGMGMEFSEITPESLAVLQCWIAELSGEAFPAAQTPTKEREAAVPGTLNTRPVLYRLINILVRNKVISEDEGATLLQQMFN